MAASSYNYYLDLPYDDYLPNIFFVPRKKKYTAHLIDGSFSNIKTEDTKELKQNILCIENDLKKDGLFSNIKTEI
jgi:hypothetical protein